MNSPDFWLTRLLLVFGVLILGPAASTSVSAAAPSKPNVLFLLADDQRADTIAALGNPVIKTPTLDALVKRGLTFRNAYCLGSSMPAVCLPSRNMILSGRAYFRWPGNQAPADQPNFPKSMNEAGYETWHYGKLGNTPHPIQKLFQTNKYLKDDEAERRSGEPGKVIVDDAITFLQQRSTERPFCMFLAFGNPHDPRVAAQHYLDLYQREQIPLPKNFVPLHPFNNGDQTLRDELLAPFPRTEADTRRQLHEYYAVITAMDGHIGRLIETLKQQKQLDNTIIVYSSDHGLAMGSHGLMGKQSLYEHSMKSPLLFAGPGIPHGEREALCYLYDIFPTICDLTATPVPPGLDGSSLALAIALPKARVRNEIVCAYRDVQRSIRDDRWKLIRYPQINKTQLFDLQQDPDEMHNLADEPTQATRISTMMQHLADWQRHMGDKLPLTSANPQPLAWTPPTASSQ